MSQIDEGKTILSTDAEEQSDGDNFKLVPVAESIRYRKRAQSAEKKVEILAEQLVQSKAQVCEMAEQLNGIQVEQKLIKRLAAAGATDLEATVLVAKARIQELPEADIDSVIEQLKKEKQYLFGDNVATAAKKTAGVRNRMTNSQTILEKAAKKAATTGNRTDLQEYLKLRRNFV